MIYKRDKKSLSKNILFFKMERANHREEIESNDSNNHYHDEIESGSTYSINHYHDEIEAILCQMERMIESIVVNIPKISATIYQLFYEMIRDEDEKFHSQMTYDFISELYEWVYVKACEHESILLDDYLYDEDGHFFEFYKKDSHYVYQELISELNLLLDHVKSVNYTPSNIIDIRDYIAEIIRIYLMVQYEVKIDK